MILIKDASKTDKLRTIAMSSSSEYCDVDASSSSSVAIPYATEKAKSPDRVFSAVDALMPTSGSHYLPPPLVAGTHGISLPVVAMAEICDNRDDCWMVVGCTAGSLATYAQTCDPHARPVDIERAIVDSIAEASSALGDAAGSQWAASKRCTRRKRSFGELNTIRLRQVKPRAALGATTCLLALIRLCLARDARENGVRRHSTSLGHARRVADAMLALLLRWTVGREPRERVRAAVGAECRAVQRVAAALAQSDVFLREQFTLLSTWKTIEAQWQSLVTVAWPRDVLRSSTPRKCHALYMEQIHDPQGPVASVLHSYCGAHFQILRDRKHRLQLSQSISPFSTPSSNCTESSGKSRSSVEL